MSIRRNPANGMLRQLSPVWLFGPIAAALLLLRDPAAILHAEFWAEDGVIWYADAYRAGWQTLFFPQNGYLQTVSRLVALAAQPFALSWAPTLFAAAALIVQVLPAAFLVSARMESAWPGIRWRMLFALVYVALPNSFETHLNPTNAQWHLAALAFLVLVSQPAKTWLGVVFDFVALGLSGLSGPFCLFLLPIAGWQCFAGRDKTSLWRGTVVVAACVIQGAFLLATMEATRSPAGLGAGVGVLARIVATQIVFGALLGARLTAQVAGSFLWVGGAVPILGAFGGLLLVVIALRRGLPILRKAVLFAAILFAAALAHPQVSMTEPQWPAMTGPGAGQRYYEIPMLAWIGCVLTLAADRNRALRILGSMLLLLLCVGIAGDWFYPRLPPTGFAEKARAFARAPPGARMEFPVEPPGFAPMVLIKHAP